MCWKDDNFRLRKSHHVLCSRFIEFVLNQTFPTIFSASVATLTKPGMLALKTALSHKWQRLREMVVDPMVPKLSFQVRNAPQVWGPQIWMTSTKGYRYYSQITFFVGSNSSETSKCSKYDQSIHNKQLDYLYMIKESFWFHEREIKNHIVTNPRCKSMLRSHHNSFGKSCMILMGSNGYVSKNHWAP